MPRADSNDHREKPALVPDIVGSAAWRRYGFAGAILALAIVAHLLAFPKGSVPFVTLFPATALAVLLCGLGPGLMVMLVGGVVGQVILASTEWSLRVLYGHVPDVVTFYACASIICLIVNQMHRARAQILKSQLEATSALQLLNAVTAGTPDVIFAKDRDGRYLLFNAAAAQIMGKNVEQVLGRDDAAIFPPELGLVFRSSDDEVIAAGRIVTYVRDLAGPMGPSTFQVIKGPLRDGGGEIVGIFGIARDISEQRKIEDDLKRAKADADRASLAKSKFLAAASHDLRQPVQSLALLLDVLKPQAVAPPVTKAIDMMEVALGALNGLLASLLDISRFDAGVVVPQLQSVDIGALLQRLCAEYGPLSEQRSLRLRCRCRQGVMVRTDPIMVERIVRNLIENAIRYTREGGVLVGARRRGGQLSIEVVDTGIGIPAENVTHIFEEFYQVGNPARDRGQGLGLGLAVVSRIAQLLGSEVLVQSVEGRGSRFTVRVPLEGTAQAVSPPQAGRAAIGGHRILVIEDDQSVRTGLRMILEGRDCAVADAQSGEDALAVAEDAAWRFDAIIADLRLGGGISGIDAASEIRKRAGKTIPVILFTGDTASERIEEVYRSGFQILYKPIMPSDLLRELAILLKTESNGEMRASPAEP